MEERTLLQKIGIQILLLNRKVILEVMSIMSFVGMGWWMYAGTFSTKLASFAVPIIGMLFSLGSFWAIRQYNYQKMMSYIFSVAISTLAISGYLLWGESILGLSLYLFSPFVLFLVAGTVACTYAVAAILIITSVSQVLGFGTGTVTNEWFLIAVYFAEFFGLVVFSAVAAEHKHRLKIAKQEVRNFQDEHRAKENFIASLSHQIRTPLSSILGITDLMKSAPLNPAQNEMVEAVVTSANNLLTLSDEILQNANISIEGAPLPDGNDFDISAEMDELLAGMCENGVADTDLDVKANYSEYLPKKMHGEPSPVVEPLEKILDAVARRSPSSSASADVFVYDKKETVSSIELLVEVHTSAFQGFTQERLSLMGVEKETDESIIQKLGLEAPQEMVLGKGGIFNVRFTSANMAIISYTVLFWKDNEDRLVIERIKQAVGESDLLDYKKITDASVLVVEDNLMNQKVVGMALKNRVKRVDFANNGKEAVKMFSNTKYDLILMDLMMPVMDGHKATAKIRELEAGTELHTPIIALTANARAGVKETCIDSGMDDYLTKPFKFDSLIAKVEEYIFASA